MGRDVIVVGAGVSGLACARGIRAAGRSVLVLERSRGVGGRCATRRVDGQPVDHGVAFLHGRSPDFLDEIGAVRELGAFGGWPVVRDGNGSPCRPAAFEPGSERFAPAAGVNGFAKYLASGVDVRLETNVTAFCAVPGEAGERGEWELVLASGEALRAGAVVLTMPAPSAAEYLAAMAPRPAAVSAILPLLEMVHTLPCLTAIARYPPGTPEPAWHVSLPPAGRALQTLIHDSSKRPPGSRLVLVLQANPRWSAEHLKRETPAEVWSRELLADAAGLHGAWLASPELMQTHTWRKARVAEGTELAQPIVVPLDGGAWLGVCGDGFHSLGGVEGAWHSGRALAARFLQRRPFP